jgi:hypothetical protein
MDLYDTVRHLLQYEPGAAFCNACLAFACDVSLSEIRTVTEELSRSNEPFHQESTCASCRRTVPSILYEVLKKCAHCSGRLMDGEASVVLGDDMFHDRCLRRVLADRTIALSRKMGARSRELIEQSRRRMADGTT